MKINPTAAYQAYGKISDRSYAFTRRQDYQMEEQVQKVEYTDRFRISPEAARQREVEQLTSSIMSEIREPTDPQRLDSLRTAVQNKTYNIPTGDLVDAVMKQWFAV